MKQTLRSLAVIGLISAAPCTAQRYLTEVFSAVDVQTNIEYGTNFSVLSGSPVLSSLVMDLYTPAGDTETDRPVIVYLHTGSFLPRYLNNLVTGSKSDSATVEMCRRFAKKGYVVAAIAYRTGWNPASPSEQTRKQTIIQAVYRSMQDAKTAVRFLRKSIAEEGNPYGISNEKIVIGGQGSGGYSALAYATLQETSEIQLLKFFNTETNEFMVDPEIMGDYEGLGGNPALNQDNHPGFSSDISMVFNIGGALGDSSWLEQGEVPICCVHGQFDPFAPYANGTVFVPGTAFAVVNVDGSSRVAELAHEYGNNDVWLDPPFTDPVTNYAQSALVGTVNEGNEGLYRITEPQNSSGPWEWWDSTTVINECAALGIDLDGAYARMANAHLSNPVYASLGQTDGRLRALAYVDTLQNFITPRMYRALVLNVGIDENSEIASGVSIAPNPVTRSTEIASTSAIIRNYVVYDNQGRMVRNGTVNLGRFTFDREALSAGSYYMELFFDEGSLTRKLILD
ncbi:MAG TPA: T9SS type A sorting domain-containing protein [Flavobacteriales bacterium]|nr:T9SS type A sorting domain-containing protein [Flavobacteriales bacterium]